MREGFLGRVSYFEEVRCLIGLFKWNVIAFRIELVFLGNT